ncbi:TPA: SDR family NAD(P)-dependent oxidoreductase [Enterobacter hormaechei subsp. steigerwaltii]|nr:SDR family NAD(P)-dependent oxidoreductase [Enterobacter hormaechei subsp. steigerwaltii]
MNECFDATSTTDNVLNGLDLSGKRILITGASAGLGVETSRALVAQGAEVVGAVRDIEKAKRAAQVIRDAAKTGKGAFSLVTLDLADLASVRQCARRLIEDGKFFDVIIANAGVMATPYAQTKDGIEIQFGTNFIGHFVLINQLFPLLNKGARVVILSSAAHARADVDLNDINFKHIPYDPWIAYGRSKTAGILFAVEFDRRAQEYGIRATAVHPGTIQTELQRHYTKEEELAMIAFINEINEKAGRPPFSYKTIRQGAATTVWAAAVAQSEEIGGRYCLDCHVAPLVDEAGSRDGVHSYAVDPDKARALWQVAEKLIGERIEWRETPCI